MQLSRRNYKIKACLLKPISSNSYLCRKFDLYPMARQLSEQEKIRREALQALKNMGVEAYPAAEVEVNGYSQELKENYEEGKQVKLAGRLMNRRIMGKASFAQLSDSKGEI